MLRNNYFTIADLAIVFFKYLFNFHICIFYCWKINIKNMVNDSFKKLQLNYILYIYISWGYFKIRRRVKILDISSFSHTCNTTCLMRLYYLLIGGGGDSTGVHDSIVNQLLTKVDGVNALNNILLIGMTNRKDLLDEALLRPGRLEVQVCYYKTSVYCMILD